MPARQQEKPAAAAGSNDHTAERNQQKELENLHRVFERCAARLPLVAPQFTKPASLRLRLDKKGDKKIDAQELGEHLKFLG